LRKEKPLCSGKFPYTLANLQFINIDVSGFAYNHPYCSFQGADINFYMQISLFIPQCLHQILFKSHADSLVFFNVRQLKRDGKGYQLFE